MQESDSSEKRGISLKFVWPKLLGREDKKTNIRGLTVDRSSLTLERP